MPAGAPVASLAAAPVGGFDVELVPVTANLSGKEDQPAPRGLRFNRRDFVLFGAGAGSVLLAILMGWLLANLATK